VDGFEFAALDLMQHGLAGHPEGGGGLVEPDPSFGDGGDNVVADGLVDPDSPRGTRGELFTGDEPIAEPSIDGDLADAEEAFSFCNGDHDSIITVIIAVGGDSIWRPVAGDAAGNPQRLDAALVNVSPVPVRRCCLDKINAIVVSS
jgi:hypothetical protein